MADPVYAFQIHGEITIDALISTLRHARDHFHVTSVKLMNFTDNTPYLKVFTSGPRDVIGCAAQAERVRAASELTKLGTPMMRTGIDRNKAKEIAVAAAARGEHPVLALVNEMGMAVTTAQTMVADFRRQGAPIPKQRPGRSYKRPV